MADPYVTGTVLTVNGGASPAWPKTGCAQAEGAFSLVDMSTPRIS